MDINAHIPEIYCDDDTLTKAFQIAVGDILGNIKTYSKGILENPSPCLMAGIDYPDTWVRDASFNVYNAGFLLSKEICKNTLLSCVHSIDGKRRIVHEQPWDCIVWSMGAWRYFCETHDMDFARFAFGILKDTLEYYESTEWDEEARLFCGPAVYGDGVAAYPDKYGCLPSFSSAIVCWAGENPEKARKSGVGNPMKTLSTNCAYVYAYEKTAKFAEVLGENGGTFAEKGRALKDRINEAFWNKKTGRYDYILGECDHAEGLGAAFSILFGIADDEKAESLAKNMPVTKNGIACVNPSFERYLKLGGYGRHSGTVWPFINAFWGLAMKKAGHNEIFDTEMRGLAEKAVRDMQFYEIYHPDTGLPYGGLQEDSCTRGISLWKSCRKQTWSATGFVSMIVDGVLGRKLTGESITFASYLPSGLDSFTIAGFRYFDADLTIKITRSGNYPKEITLPRGCASQEIILSV